ncbi:unnamed protein product, partial [Staurois parvus]
MPPVSAASSATQCPAVSPISAAHQCHPSMMPSSAADQCRLSVPPVGAISQCHLSVPIIAAYQHISASSVPPHQCPPV